MMLFRSTQTKKKKRRGCECAEIALAKDWYELCCGNKSLWRPSAMLLMGQVRKLFFQAINSKLNPKNPHKLSVVPSHDNLRRFRVCIDLQAGFSALILRLIPKCVWSLSYTSICVHWVEKFFVAVRNAITIRFIKLIFQSDFSHFPRSGLCEKEGDSKRLRSLCVQLMCL